MTGRFPLLAPVAVALLIRLVAWCGAEWALEVRQAEFLVPGDAGGYVELSADVASGRPYAIDEDVPFSRRAMRPPLFPLVLAGPVAADLRLFPVRAPGYGKWLLARLAVVLLATAAVWATGRLGAAVAGPRVGAAAAWLAAVNPLAVAFGVMLLSESLFALLATLSLWGVAECVRPDGSRAKPSPRWHAGRLGRAGGGGGGADPVGLAADAVRRRGPHIHLGSPRREPRGPTCRRGESLGSRLGLPDELEMGRRVPARVRRRATPRGRCGTSRSSASRC